MVELVIALILSFLSPQSGLVHYNLHRTHQIDSNRFGYFRLYGTYPDLATYVGNGTSILSTIDQQKDDIEELLNTTPPISRTNSKASVRQNRWNTFQQAKTVAYGGKEGSKVTLSSSSNRKNSNVIFSSDFDHGTRKPYSTGETYSTTTNSYKTTKTKNILSDLSTARKPWRSRKDTDVGDNQAVFPTNIYRNIAYDHIASSSLGGIEALPSLRFSKGKSYLVKWWQSAKKWNILCDELKQLDKEYNHRIEFNFTDNENSFSTSVDNVIGNGLSPDDKKRFNYKNDGNSFDRKYNDPISSTSGTSHGSNFDRTIPMEELLNICSIHKSRVIVIGDVHGCLEELQDLLREVKYYPGDLVVLLGDLVAKGPKSVDVVRLAMDIGALAVRGNHDHELVRQAIIYKEKSEKSNKWMSITDEKATTSIYDNNFKVNTRVQQHLELALQLNSRELNWIAELPYFIRSVDLGSVFVHAGFKTGKRLQEQDPWVMMTARSNLPDGRMSPRCFNKYPWAPSWRGPLTVYFGHDAARGLQQYDCAVGLDTGEYFIINRACSVYFLFFI